VTSQSTPDQIARWNAELRHQAPLEIIRWPAKPHESALQAVAARADRREQVVEVSEDEFFGDLQRTEDAGRFAQLRQMMHRTLSDIHIFRVGAGSVRVTIYIIGKAARGDWAALRTVSIET